MTAARRPLLLLSSLAALTATGAAERWAGARSSNIVPYPSSEVWPAAIRFLRVDRGYPVKEKDQAAGYVLFEITESKHVYRAALELVKTSDADGRVATEMVCSAPDLSMRYEATLLEKLAAKIRDERGPPAPPPKPPVASGGETEPPRPPPKDEKPPPDIDNLPRPPTWGPPPAR